ncbi:MAG: hypothetical protein GY722_18885 [bacterium]|nr:hypothetical protein [bacterium]
MLFVATVYTAATGIFRSQCMQVLPRDFEQLTAASSGRTPPTTWRTDAAAADSSMPPCGDARGSDELEPDETAMKELQSVEDKRSP